MKRIILTTSASLLMIGFVSCNQEEYFNMVATSSVTEISSVPETVDEDFVLSALCDSVDLLNTRYGIIINNDAGGFLRNTGALDSKTKNEIVIAADAIGAVVGYLSGPGSFWGRMHNAITTATKYSAEARKFVQEIGDLLDVLPVNIPLNSLNDVIFNPTPISNPSPTVGDSIGYIHNDVLIEVYGNYVSRYNYVTSDVTQSMQIIDSVFSAKYPQLIPPSHDFQDVGMMGNDDPTVGLIYELRGQINSYSTFDRFIQNLTLRSGYLSESQCELFNRCVHGVQSAYDNGTSIQYTQALLQVIYSSELSDDMKSCLMGSIVVTNASCRLWNEDAYGSVQVEDM